VNVLAPPAPLTPVGRFPWVAFTGTGYGGKLFAAAPDGLYGRDGGFAEGNGQGAVDLVWRKIGAVPDATFALAGANGRLFALSGDPQRPTLWWRSEVPEIPWRDPLVVFWRSHAAVTTSTHHVARFGITLPIERDVSLAPWTELLVGEMRSNGDFRQLRIAYGPHADLIVRASENADAFFYKNDGSATLCRFGATGECTVLREWSAGSFCSASGAWSIISYVGYGRILFYDAQRGDAIIGHFSQPVSSAHHAHQARSEWVQVWAGPIGDGWTSITAANQTPNGKYVLLYDRNTGNYRIAWILPNGAFKRATYSHQPDDRCSRGWTHLVPAGQSYILFYNGEDPRKSAGTGETVPGDIALAEFAHGRFATAWRGYVTQRELNNLLMGTSNGLVALYSTADGRCTTWGVRPTAVISAVYEGPVALRAANPELEMDIAQGSASAPWPHVTCLGGAL
jgi:hypothetical protein